MPHDVIMPALGMAQETGVILSWLKKPGDQVSPSDALMEVETDKAVMEVEAAAEGVLSDVKAAAGESVPVGQVVAVILDPEEVLSTQISPTEKPSGVAPHGATSTGRGQARHRPQFGGKHPQGGPVQYRQTRFNVS